VKKVGVFVGENKWTFFDEIFQELNRLYETDVFTNREIKVPLLHGRVNRWAFQHRLQASLKRNDICFFEWASDLLAAASHMRKTSKIVTRLHSFELYEWAPRINWKNVDRIIVLSEAMRSMFAELYPDQAQKLVIIHNGCSLDRFSFIPDKKFSFTIGMLCTITPIKRIYEIVLMLNTLVNRGFPATLRIGGNPDHDERYAVAIHRLVRKLGLQNQVFFDGFVQDTSAWLQKVDVFISNSYWEGQQVALIEALASGCICLAHCWNGADEMLPPDHIYVTTDDLLEKLISYSSLSAMERQMLRMQMRLCAEEKFDLNLIKNQIVELIEEEYSAFLPN